MNVLEEPIGNPILQPHNDQFSPPPPPPPEIPYLAISFQLSKIDFFKFVSFYLLSEHDIRSHKVARPWLESDSVEFDKH